MGFIAKRPVLSLSLAVFVCASCGYMNNVPDAVTASNWRVLYDNSASLEQAVRAADWRPITIPSKFKLPYKPKRDYQHVWLKSKFFLNEKPSEYCGIHMGRVYYLDQVYVNGRLIGERRADDAISIHYPRNYTIPENLLVKGDNQVFVRLGVYGNKFGSITDPVLLLKKKEFKTIRSLDTYINHHVPLSIAIALIGQFVFFVIFLLWSGNLATIFNLVYLALGAMLPVSDMLGVGFFGHEVRLAIQASILTALPLQFIVIVQWYYRVYLPKLNIGLAVYMLVAMLLTWSNLDTTSDYYLAEIISNSTMFLAFAAGIYTLAYANSVKPDRTKLALLIIFILLPSAEVLFEIISHYFMSGVARYTGIGFLMIYMAVFMAILARNIIGREIELRVMYHGLESRAGNGNKRQSPEKDERIDEVIDFIKNNFMSDLSREGLASSIDVSSDFLSKKFNAVTGKRIDEYINELRVREAVTLLCETDRKIIDIAFSVGFESLSTFNRIFSRQTGTSPKNYRQKSRAAAT